MENFKVCNIRSTYNLLQQLKHFVHFGQKAEFYPNGSCAWQRLLDDRKPTRIYLRNNIKLKTVSKTDLKLGALIPLNPKTISQGSYSHPIIRKVI